MPEKTSPHDPGAGSWPAKHFFKSHLFLSYCKEFSYSKTSASYLSFPLVDIIMEVNKISVNEEIRLLPANNRFLSVNDLGQIVEHREEVG